jgi:hypothetical protein
VSGAGLARGYFNRPDLSQRTFIPNPFHHLQTDSPYAYLHKRMFKTGDMVRRLDGGILEYIGRRDFQVKIRGNRVELCEIENVLIQNVEGIEEILVVCNERNADDQMVVKYLVAYYVSTVDIPLTLLTSVTSQYLPEYMVPHFFMHLKEFPRTMNGKVARNDLPLPNFSEVNTSEETAHPATQMEHELMKMWKSVLKNQNITTTDDFFRVGGDSILSMQLCSRLQGVDVFCHVHDVSNHRTIQRLAAFLESNVGPAGLFLPTEQGKVRGLICVSPSHY